MKSDTPIEDCQNFAKEQGFSVFAVQFNKECFTAADAAETFNQYGLSAACQNDGRGGSKANNVYQVTCEGKMFDYMVQRHWITNINYIFVSGAP